MQDLTLSLVQADLQWEDKPANLNRLDGLIASINTTTDLILLPEMFNTGFSMNATELAEDMHGPTIKWMKEKARQYRAVIMGSLIIKQGSRFYNRLIVAQPDQNISFYDKRHLFRMADEHLTFHPGDNHLIFELNGWKIQTLVCYDLRFPVWSRNRYIPEQGWNYDLAIYVANWPAARAHPWKTLPIARAIENQSYVATVNRVGRDGKDLPYSGDSQIINSFGETLILMNDQEGVHTQTLNRTLLDKHRKNFPVGWDADDFEIRITNFN